MPEDFEEHDEKIEVGFQPKFIQNIVKIGEVRSLEMNVYQITHHSENDPRISLSRDSFRLLAQYGIKRALILFISESSLNYRLSLVTIDLKWEEGKRVKKEYSNPHRYSFFLGPETKTHTPETYLIKKGRIKDFEDLKNRFSIEVVNKDFYTQIAIRFTKLAGGQRTIGRTKYEGKGSLILPSTTDDKTKKEFSVRLIGRLIFCWFLKKKTSDKGIALLPEELLSSKSVTQKPGFYHNILETLFFETLNKPIKQRKKEFQLSPWSEIPFLNGGLFTPEYHDYYQVDQLGISKYINTLKVPDSWLKELFEIFETYNFTIDENTSIDVELSIEPEMLGRIFENLLAEINPETGNTARKSTGSYYTPRPIVEYMVDESLKQYLLTKTNIDENKISSLLAYEEEEVSLSESEKDVVLNALDVIKIIDPACGSGAFPMGILQKMLLILQKIDPESKKWLLKKISQIDNGIVKNEITKKLQNANWNYVHKLGIIQSSIYGVDIQPIAVDISKLRFFLSLIVDERIDDSKPNRGIESLPNLEFKFVCANSLVGLPSTLVGSYKKGLQPKLFETVDNITELKKLREEYFRCYGDEKKSIEKKFQDIQSRMFLSSLKWLKWGGKDSQTVKLSQWNPFSGESCKWFDPEWMFGARDRFDVVIANPPYGATLDLSTKGYVNNTYLYTKGNSNSAILFIEKGIQLLSEKGIISYIIPKSFLYSNTWETARRILKEELEALLDVGKSFENVLLEQVVFVARKGVKSSFILTAKMLQEGRLRKEIIVKKSDCELFGIYLIGLSLEEIRIGKKIMKNKKKFTDVCYIRRGLDIQKYLKKKNWDIPVYRCKSISRYVLKCSNEGITTKILEEIYCDIKYMLNPRIIMQNIVAHVMNPVDHIILMATIDKEGIICLGSVGNIFINNKLYSLEFLTALLNSRLISWYAYRFIYGHAIRTMRFDNFHLSKLPLPEIDYEEQKTIISLVDNILSITDKNDYLQNKTKEAKVKEYENQIDGMVYKLYDLTEEEIEIVENFNKKA